MHTYLMLPTAGVSFAQLIGQCTFSQSIHEVITTGTDALKRMMLLPMPRLLSHARIAGNFLSAHCLHRTEYRLLSRLSLKQIMFILR